MEGSILEKVKENVEKEPYVRLFDIKILELKQGYCRAQMKVKMEHKNLHSTTHGGAIFSLVDIAFGAAGNSYGYIMVGLNLSINYNRPSNLGDILTAEAKEISRGKTIGIYNIIVKNDDNKIIASSQATGFIKKERHPFFD